MTNKIENIQVGKIIQLLRNLDEISQEKLSDQLGVSRAYLSQVENGLAPGLKFREDAARIFDIPMALLVSDSLEADSEIYDALRKLFADILAAKVFARGIKVDESDSEKPRRNKK